MIYPFRGLNGRISMYLYVLIQTRSIGGQRSVWSIKPWFSVRTFIHFEVSIANLYKLIQINKIQGQRECTKCNAAFVALSDPSIFERPNDLPSLSSQTPARNSRQTTGKPLAQYFRISFTCACPFRPELGSSTSYAQIKHSISSGVRSDI